MHRSSPLRPLCRLLALAAALLLASPAAARQAPPPGAPGEPGSELRVYVMTMGPGDLVWERFGHNALWVHDPARGADPAYNWGIFDFDQANFFLNFARGRMLYSMMPFDATATVQHYQASNRDVWVQELNLTPAQKRDLRDYLEWNARPENRDYRYDYYRDNCSTRVRDALDRVLGGAIRRQTEALATGATYRWHTRRATTDGPVMYTLLETGLGPLVDRPISAWEEMFLPLKLRDHLRRVTVPGAGGAAAPLVAAEQTVFTADRPPLDEAPPRWIPVYLLLGGAVGGVLALLGARARAHGGARLGLSLVGGVWSLLSGVGGAILAGLWALTDHEVAYRNENLLQLSPFALALVVLLPLAAYGSPRASRRALRVAVLVAALSLLGFALQALPGLDQVNGEIVALALPINLGVAWALYRLGREGAGNDDAARGPAAARGRRAAALGTGD